MPVPVIVELRFGFLNGTTGRENEANLVRFLDRARVEVLCRDEETAVRYAELKLQLKKQGTPVVFDWPGWLDEIDAARAIVNRQFGTPRGGIQRASQVHESSAFSLSIVGGPARLYQVARLQVGLRAVEVALHPEAIVADSARHGAREPSMSSTGIVSKATAETSDLRRTIARARR